MPDMPGDTFASKGILYILGYGATGKLRPFTVGPLAAAAAKGAKWLPRLGWPGLAVGAIALAGAAIWWTCKDEG